MRFSAPLAGVAAACICCLAPSALSNVLIDNFTSVRTVNPSIEGPSAQVKQDSGVGTWGGFSLRSMAAYGNGFGGSGVTTMGSGQLSLNTAAISNPTRNGNGAECRITYALPSTPQSVFNWSDSGFAFDIRTWATKLDSNVDFILMVTDDSLHRVVFDLRTVLVNSATDPIARITKSQFTPYAYSSPGQMDWSRVYEVSIRLSPLTRATTPAEMAVSINHFSYVPAPGAAALLGAAGLLGRRRRA